MNKTLILLILVIIVLCWNFVFTDKKVGLTDQAKVLQGLSMAISYKTAVASYWRQKGSLPNKEDWLNQQQSVTVDISQTIVDSIEVGVDGPGVISVHYTAKPGLEFPAEIDGKKINLIPTAGNAKLDWTCVGTLAPALLPANCNK